MFTRVEFAILKRENENVNTECIDVQTLFSILVRRKNVHFSEAQSFENHLLDRCLGKLLLVDNFQLLKPVY